jgi:CRP/FNR family transcriptional regulator, cyclic AMP receptor protein
MRGVYGADMDVEEAIKNAPLFSQLSKKDIKQLTAVMTPRSYRAGEVIIEKGKQGLGFFIIATGTAKVAVGGDQLRELKAGDHFGEIALIDEGTRMAEVRAESDVETYVLASWQFRPFIQDHPDVAWALMQSLVKRIVRDHP